MSYQTLLGLCYVIHYTSKSGQFIIVRAHNSYNELELYHELHKQFYSPKFSLQVICLRQQSAIMHCHNIYSEYFFLHVSFIAIQSLLIWLIKPVKAVRIGQNLPGLWNQIWFHKILI